MAKGLKFLVDEHIYLSVVKALKIIKIDIVSLKDLGLLGIKDEEILKFANKEERIIVTSDRDFLVFNSRGEKHKGIIFLTKRLGIGDLIKELQDIEIQYKPEELEGVVLYIPRNF